MRRAISSSGMCATSQFYKEPDRDICLHLLERRDDAWSSLMAWREQPVTTSLHALTKPSRPREDTRSHRRGVIFTSGSDASWHKTYCGIREKDHPAAKLPRAAAL